MRVPFCWEVTEGRPLRRLSGPLQDTSFESRGKRWHKFSEKSSTRSVSPEERSGVVYPSLFDKDPVGILRGEDGVFRRRSLGLDCPGGFSKRGVHRKSRIDEEVV